MEIKITNEKIYFNNLCAEFLPDIDGFIEPVTDTVDNIVGFLYTTVDHPSNRKIYEQNDGFYIHHKKLSNIISETPASIKHITAMEDGFIVDLTETGVRLTQPLNWIPERDPPIPVSSFETVYNYPETQVFKLEKGYSGGVVGIAYIPDIHSKIEVVERFFQENKGYIKSQQSIHSIILEAGSKWSDPIYRAAEKYASEILETEYKPDRSIEVKEIISEKNAECQECQLSRTEQIKQYGRDFSVDTSEKTVYCSSCQSSI
jgi:hypothetical protein